MITEPKAAIVVGGDSPTMLSVVRSLGEEGVPVYAIFTTRRKAYVARSKYIKKAFYVDYSVPAIINFLTNDFPTHDLNYKPLLILTNDFLVKTVDENLDILKNRYIVQNIGFRQGAVVKMMNKYYMFELAKECGLNVPNSIMLDLEDEIIGDFEDFEYPCIVKPIDSVEGGKDYIKKCNDEHAIYEYLCELKSDSKVNTVVIQEYVHGIQNFMIDLMGLSLQDGTIYLPGFFKKIRQLSNLKRSDNIDGNCSMTLLTNESFNVPLDKVEKFIKLTGYIGMFDLEFKVVDGKPVFIEINFRIGGPSYIYIAAGINLPYFYYLDSYNNNVKGLLRRIEKDSFAMMENRDFKNVLDGKISFIKWLKDFITCDIKMIWNTKDMRPFFYFILFVFTESRLKEFRSAKGKTQ